MIQSNWDTNNYFCSRHQLRAQVIEDIVHVELIEQTMIERIFTWLANIFGSKSIYSHKLKEQNFKILTDSAQLNSCIKIIFADKCKLDETGGFNAETVWDRMSQAFHRYQSESLAKDIKVEELTEREKIKIEADSGYIEKKNDFLREFEQLKISMQKAENSQAPEMLQNFLEKHKEVISYLSLVHQIKI